MRQRDPVVPAWLSISLFLIVSCGIVASLVYGIGMTLVIGLSEVLSIMP